MSVLVSRTAAWHAPMESALSEERSFSPALLGCSEGTVKSSAARGLQHLRALSALADDTDDDPAELTEKNS